jgi:MYXO-CTERM domain-containing protein
MRLTKALFLSIPVLALALSHANDASACGGCFHETGAQPPANIDVTGHKMLVSVSTTQTTLWDQISYTGDPASFAWVLPVKGNVTFALSSDALFQNLDAETRVEVSSQGFSCTLPSICIYGGGSGTGISYSTGTGEPYPTPVMVTAQAVVGPYSVVTLHSSDPAALTTWLTANSFAIPDDVKPIITAYVGEGFDFVAVKLVPGMPVKAMRPVRVTTPGGGAPVLPLRMVGVGTGAITPVTLWVYGAGRYGAANMPEFTVQPYDVTWDLDTQSSDYSTLRQAGFDASQGKAWLVEEARPVYTTKLQDTLSKLATDSPLDSGYADDLGGGAVDAATSDLAALVGNLDPATLWVTRLHGELSREALKTDLTLALSAKQDAVLGGIFVSKLKGTMPTCMVYPPCDPGTQGGTSGGTGGTGGAASSSGGSGCAMAPAQGSSSMLGAVTVLAALALLRRRQDR